MLTIVMMRFCTRVSPFQGLRLILTMNTQAWCPQVCMQCTFFNLSVSLTVTVTVTVCAVCMYQVCSTQSVSVFVLLVTPAHYWRLNPNTLEIPDLLLLY
jgi:hypothetical protein